MAAKRNTPTTSGGFRDNVNAIDPETPFGELLRRARAKRNASQEEVGKECGVAQSVYARWEKGRVLPKLHRLPIIAQVLDIPVGDLREAAEQSSTMIHQGLVTEPRRTEVGDMRDELAALRLEIARLKAAQAVEAKPAPRKQARKRA